MDPICCSDLSLAACGISAQKTPAAAKTEKAAKALSDGQVEVSLKEGNTSNHPSSTQKTGSHLLIGI